jgi:hypothetical protein
VENWDKILDDSADNEKGWVNPNDMGFEPRLPVRGTLKSTKITEQATDILVVDSAAGDEASPGAYSPIFFVNFCHETADKFVGALGISA